MGHFVLNEVDYFSHKGTKGTKDSVAVAPSLCSLCLRVRQK